MDRQMPNKLNDLIFITGYFFSKRVQQVSIAIQLVMLQHEQVDTRKKNHVNQSNANECENFIKKY